MCLATTALVTSEQRLDFHAMVAETSGHFLETWDDNVIIMITQGFHEIYT